MARHAFRSMQEPPPRGPHSAAVSAGHLVFVSAQLPVDERGAVVGGSAAEQARRALDAVGHQLRSTGLSPDAVATVTVYLVDPADAAPVDDAFAAFFAEPRPARTLVGVAWLPGGALVQIEAVAVRY
ncbi:MAG: RidA family protein [Actinobacteria bacterium]|nr:RidA family protein [Actinomycetota bacterium]